MSRSIEPRKRTPKLPRSVARDVRLSRRARGVVCELWSHVEGRTFTARELWEATKDSPAVEKRDAIYAAVAEAREVGYIVPVSELTPDGWEVRYALHRAAAPGGLAAQEDFVFVPWAVLRDASLSYRARGLLVEQLADGATVARQTITVFRGGLIALGGRRPDGHTATKTAFRELEVVGYAVRMPAGRDAAGRLTEGRILFRSYIPVNNSTDATPPLTSTDGMEPQVESSERLPDTDSQEDRATCDGITFSQVEAGDEFSGSFKDSQDSPKENDHLGLRSFTTAHLGDARNEPTTPQAANPQDHSSAGSCPAPETPTSWRGKPSAKARGVLASLPRVWREGAPGWVLNRMAEKIDEMLQLGYWPGAIVAAAYEDRILVDLRHHTRALRALEKSLRVDRMTGHACDDCGMPRLPGEECRTCSTGRCDRCGDRVSAGSGCPTCAHTTRMQEAELRELAAILDDYGVNADEADRCLAVARG